MAKSIMIQGTCSNAGKSIITAGLCRIFTQDGYNTAPFKSQNMALNSYVTLNNLEMGRAQVTQSYACKKKPDVRMNPVLLKPTTDMKSQVIVMGKPIGTMSFTEYRSLKQDIINEIKKAYNSLASENDIIVIEGAGSPAEINLKKDEIVNMFIAKMTRSPVLLTGDIDRGGIFASFLGTLMLLDRQEKKYLKGFIINKFRGNPGLLKPGIEILEKKTRRKNYGIIPYFNDIDLPDEDSVDFKSRSGKHSYSPDYSKDIIITVIDLPFISNFTDFDIFRHEKDVSIYISTKPESIRNADIIIIPGSKNVIDDLLYLKKHGFTGILKALVNEKIIFGICGGFQMLGSIIYDPYKIESNTLKINGLGLLDVETCMEKNKQLSQTSAVWIEKNQKLKGYEIHHGISKSSEIPFLKNNNNEVIGVQNKNMTIYGTYLHGIFDNHDFRTYIINLARNKKKLPPKPVDECFNPDNELSKLADLMRENLDIKGIYKLFLK